MRHVGDLGADFLHSVMSVNSLKEINCEIYENVRHFALPERINVFSTPLLIRYDTYDKGKHKTNIRKLYALFLGCTALITNKITSNIDEICNKINFDIQSHIPNSLPGILRLNDLHVCVHRIAFQCEEYMDSRLVSKS